MLQDTLFDNLRLGSAFGSSCVGNQSSEDSFAVGELLSEELLHFGSHLDDVRGG